MLLRGVVATPEYDDSVCVVVFDVVVVLLLLVGLLTSLVICCSPSFPIRSWLIVRCDKRDNGGKDREVGGGGVLLKLTSGVVPICH